MSFVGATGYSENQEQFDILKDEIDANASYINNLVGIPDPLHTAIFGINILNPGLFGLVERAEVKIKLLETGEETLGTDITGLTTQVEGIQTEVAGIQTEITGIQGEITGVQGEISSIQFIQLPALTGVVSTIGGIAGDAEIKANRALGIWDYSGDNVYHKKSGNVGIGTTFGSVLNNRLEVNGNINIPTGSTFRIGDEPFNYTHLAGTQPVSSKWTNATDVATNIYYNTGNVGIGVTTAINNKLEVAGNINIPTGSKYKINNVDLAFSDLGTLSYNSLSDKPTLFDGNYNSLSNKPTLFDGNYNSLTNKLTGGTNIQILNGAINNLYSYTLPTAGVGSGGVLGGVRVDNSTIFINGSGVISSAAGTPQVNSDWNETNTSLKSFILNKPTIVNSRWSKNGNEISYNDGNVGIGTTNPFNVLHLHKFGILQEVGLILSDDASISSSVNRGLQLIKGANNEGYLFNYENKELIIGTNGTERMRISNTGSVGIGTNANISGVLLDVNGTIESRTGIGASSVFYFRGVANSDINRVISAGQYSTGSAVNDMVIRSTNKLVLQSGIADPAIVISTNNSVGIGTTAPQSLLHLHRTATAQDVRIILTDGTTTASGSRGFHIVKTPDRIAYVWNIEDTPLILGTSGTERMRILGTGNIGIGVNNPQRPLQVQSAMRISGTGACLDFGDDFNTQLYKNGTANEIAVATSGVEKFRITPNGLRFQDNIWHATLSGNERFFFNTNATTYLKGYSNSGRPIEFRNGSDATIAYFETDGQFVCSFQTRSVTDTDHLVVANNTNLFAVGQYKIHIAHNTFTGFHRCYYEDDEIFTNNMLKEEIDIFKNNYKGRIVISTGKIKTDFTREVGVEEVGVSSPSDEQSEEVKIEDITEEETTKEEPPPISSIPTEITKNEWYSTIDKDGITIEDAIPIVQLSRVKKDKRVYGVLGSPTRSTNNINRLIVNSVGEGAICVCNTNGNIENGDYIQSSELLGFGEKQDDDILHNYSVAKAVMDCTFELDSPYYQCYELENGVRVAFIACTYHCG